MPLVDDVYFVVIGILSEMLSFFCLFSKGNLSWDMRCRLGWLWRSSKLVCLFVNGVIVLCIGITFADVFSVLDGDNADDEENSSILEIGKAFCVGLETSWLLSGEFKEGILTDCSPDIVSSLKREEDDVDEAELLDVEPRDKISLLVLNLTRLNCKASISCLFDSSLTTINFL